MKTFVSKLIAGAGLCAALVFAQDASASGQITSFGITNALLGTNVISGFPTNYYNPTNGFSMSTGHGVPIGNFDRLGLNLQGFLANTGVATHVTFSFVSSCAAGPPQITVGTNLLSVGQTVLLQNDWTSTNSMVFVDIPIPATTTNWYNWTTNYVGAGAFPFIDANYLGVYSISNFLSPGSTFTNVTLGVNTKLLPRPLIGN